MAKIANDKYFTPQHIVELVIQRTKEVIGLDNITEFIEPSAGNGAFLDKLHELGKPVYAYDLYPEREDIIEQDYLKLDREYKEGVCVIGNPPFGDRNNLYRKFYNKSVEFSDYIVFIGGIKLLNNSTQNYKFDLIYSEDLGKNFYSGINLHCCLNIYKRPMTGLNKRISNKLKDITLYREDQKGYLEINEDFKVCRMGDIWKIIYKEDKNLRNFKVVINNTHIKQDIINVIMNKYMTKNKNNSISTPYIVKEDIYKYLKEQIPELE